MRYAKLAAACLPGVFAPLAVAGDQGIILVGNGGLIDGSTNTVYVEAHISDQLAGNLYRCEIPDVELTPPDYMLFDGWYSQPSGGMRYPGAEITVPAGSWRNVYAHWRYDTYEVAYSETGGDADLRVQTATNGIPAYAEECQTEDSGVMRFVGWVDGNGANHRPGELLDKSMEGDVLTALWEYNVEFAANGGNPAATNVWLKKSNNLPPVSSLFARKGYRFANWALASDGSGGKYENQSRFGDIFEGGWIAGEDVLYAQW
ncbi:MAG: InlB B-repeat-containing protein, partial [Kiritimatiellae bacterium]|nr:InlB B-repeat-containing protein [Kiritimatiellia bacterium]